MHLFALGHVKGVGRSLSSFWFTVGIDSWKNERTLFTYVPLGKPQFCQMRNPGSLLPLQLSSMPLPCPLHPPATGSPLLLNLPIIWALVGKYSWSNTCDDRALQPRALLFPGASACATWAAPGQPAASRAFPLLSEPFPVGSWSHLPGPRVNVSLIHSQALQGNRETAKFKWVFSTELWLRHSVIK